MNRIREKEKDNLQKISYTQREDTKKDNNAVNEKRKHGYIQGKDGTSWEDFNGDKPKNKEESNGLQPIHQ